jgi:ATP-dependent Clp protease ATP-binding subunit ClpA
MLDNESIRVLAYANSIAHVYNDESIEPIHLLFSILRVNDAAAESIRSDIDEQSMIEWYQNVRIAAGGEMTAIPLIPYGCLSTQAITTATVLGAIYNAGVVTAIHLLYAILSINDNRIRTMFTSLRVDISTKRNQLGEQIIRPKQSAES